MRAGFEGLSILRLKACPIAKKNCTNSWMPAGRGTRIAKPGCTGNIMRMLWGYASVIHAHGKKP